MATARQSSGSFAGARFSRVDSVTAPRSEHSHEVAFLACLDRGLIELRSALGAWVVFPDAITFVPSDFPHVARAITREVSGWRLALPASAALALGSVPLTIEANELLVALCRRLMEGGGRVLRPAKRERVAAVLLDELEQAPTKRTFAVPLPRTPGLVRVSNAIVSAPGDMNTIDHWANYAAMSRRSFTRHFAQETGMTFGSWRHRVKIHAALRMLSDGASVTATGIDLGYQSTSAFISMFGRCVGISPAAYTRRIAPTADTRFKR